MITGHYLQQHLPEGLLSPDDARASRLDSIAFVELLRELNQRDWRDDLHCACILYRSEDPRQIPVALAIATKKQYRDSIRRPVELDWDSTNQYRTLDDQWCLEYLVRSSDRNITRFRKNSRHVHLHWPRSWTASSKVLSTTTSTYKFHNTFS